jgi:asparagine synthase (glutamine-hydrolysing)
MITSVYKETRWHEVPWLKNPRSLSQSRVNLHDALEAAVAKRLTTVRDIGACLSGGLDSSLVAALAARQLRLQGIKLHTYSIGMAGSPDLEHARLVAAHINSEHHECIISPEECLNAIPIVIRAIESCDVTTVRASVGNYLLGRFIATVTPTVKVILNGDGADEALGGYLYMRAAPTDAAFEAETTRLLTEMHRYDVARSERSMAAHGLESRSPFLDRQFIAVARGASTAVLRPSEDRIEKHVLRDAFSFPHDDVLPLKVLWRRKEAFSDGISGKEKSWFEMAKAVGEQLYSDFDQTKYRTNPPQTAEAFWYRELYHTYFHAVSITATTPYMWMPRFIKGVTDPSARTLSAYKA